MSELTRASQRSVPQERGTSLRCKLIGKEAAKRAESEPNAGDKRETFEGPSLDELLTNFKDGEDRSIDALLPLVYAELKMLAAHQLGKEPSGGKMHTLQPTALVHEAFMKLAGRGSKWGSREHFMAVASRAMRQVLVDHARRKRSDKRGGGAAHADVNLEAMEICGPNTSREVRIVELDILLTELYATDERAARVAEMRLFGGMDLEQMATALGTSRMTVVRDWQLARAWLAAKVLDSQQMHGERS